MSIVTMLIGVIVTWGLPLVIMISMIILFRKVYRLEKRISKKDDS